MLCFVNWHVSLFYTNEFECPFGVFNISLETLGRHYTTDILFNDDFDKLETMLKGISLLGYARKHTTSTIFMTSLGILPM